MTDLELEKIVEAVVFASGKAMTPKAVAGVFPEELRPDPDHIKDILIKLQDEYTERGVELKELGTGFAFQVRKETSHVVARLWEEKPARYSRALLETLALIAYRQPITRGEIEDIRGVVTNSQIIRTLMEHEFIRVVGHKDIPGRPALLATTKEFLAHFNLKDLESLPPLAEITDLEQAAKQLFNEAGGQGELFEDEQAEELENSDEEQAELEELEETEEDTNNIDIEEPK